MLLDSTIYYIKLNRERERGEGGRKVCKRCNKSLKINYDDASKLNKSKAISNLFSDLCRHAVLKRGISKKY